MTEVSGTRAKRSFGDRSSQAELGTERGLSHPTETPRGWRGVLRIRIHSAKNYFASHHQRPCGKAGLVAVVDSF